MNTILVTFFLVFAGTPEPEPGIDIRETILVEASKTQTPLDESGNSVFVVTDADIAQHQWRTLAEVLHFMPGVSLVPTGGAGGITNVFLRGAKPEDTLVLINGVKMNDAAGTGRGYDFAHLSTAGVARVELILGPQSTLYGSDASAGVINIIMQEGAQPRYSLNLESSFESNTRGGFNFGGGNGPVRYAGGLEYGQSEDLSASALNANGDASLLEEDRYTHLNGHASFNLDLSETRRLSLALIFLDTQADIDAFDSDDPNYTSDYRQTGITLGYEDQPNGGRWFYRLQLTRSQTDRDSVNEIDPAHPQDSSLGSFKGVNQGVEFRNSFSVNDKLLVVAGLTLDREEGEGRSGGTSEFGPYDAQFGDDADLFGVFSQARISLDSGFHASLGGRYDDHSQFGSKTTWQGSLGYRFEATGTRLRGFYGTGYRAPSIYQLFGDFGNAGLLEETSRTWEAGVTQDLLGGAMQAGFTWYDGFYENLIDFGFDATTGFFGYLNLADEVATSGLEVFLAYSGEKVHARLTYEDADAEQKSLDFAGNPMVTSLIRRFGEKASLLLGGTMFQQLDWNLDVLDYGPVGDTNFISFQPVTLDGYTLVNLGLAWRLNDDFTISAKAQNLTDEAYTAIYGYNTHGSRFFLGLNYAF